MDFLLTLQSLEERLFFGPNKNHNNKVSTRISTEPQPIQLGNSHAMLPVAATALYGVLDIHPLPMAMIRLVTHCTELGSSKARLPILGKLVAAPLTVPDMPRRLKIRGKMFARRPQSS
jgi:hypothetical protein